MARNASRKFAPVRSAPLRSAWAKFALAKSASRRFAPLRSDSVKSHQLRVRSAQAHTGQAAPSQVLRIGALGIQCPRRRAQNRGDQGILRASAHSALMHYFHKNARTEGFLRGNARSPRCPPQCIPWRRARARPDRRRCLTRRPTCARAAPGGPPKHNEKDRTTS